VRHRKSVAFAMLHIANRPIKVQKLKRFAIISFGILYGEELSTTGAPLNTQNHLCTHWNVDLFSTF
jgi:hypothetical protein